MGVSIGWGQTEINGVTPTNTLIGEDWYDMTYIMDSTGNTLSTIQVSYLAASYGTYVYAVEVNGQILVDTGISGDPGVVGDTTVTVGPFTAEGTIQSVDGTEVELSASSGRWIADNKAGTPFSFVPTIPIVDTTNEAYGKLQIINDKAQVTGIQATDPGFLNVTSQDYTVQFPSVFATGNAPDTDLPDGTSISVIVKAENVVGESTVESNLVMPSLPNPEGAAGPITNATTTELTVGNSANLDTFVASDAVVMVDDTGAVASYTPVTSTIASVDALTLSTPTVSGGFSFRNGEFYGNPSTPVGSVATYGIDAARANGEITFNPPITASSKIEVWAYIDSGEAPDAITINGSSTITIPGGTNFAYQKVNCNTTSLSSLAYTYPGTSVDLWLVGFYVDDVWYGTDYKSTTLTFEDPNPDLQYFLPGDVVQPAVKVWSDYVTPVASINPSYPAPKLFNGSDSLDYTNGCTAVSGGDVITWQPGTPITNVENLIIGGYITKGADAVFNVNGINVTEANGGGSPSKILTLPKATYFPDGVLTNIAWNYKNSSNYVYLTYIEVNGALLADSTVENSDEVKVVSTDTTANTMTVDGGAWRTAWNQSEVWSNNLSGGPYASSFPVTAAFDGNPNTGALSNNVADAVTYTGTFENVTSLKLRVRPIGMTDSTIYRISGTGIVSIDVGGSDADSLLDLTLTQTTVSNITIALVSGPSSPGFSGIELNGSLLVDSSVTPTGDTEVTGPAKSGVGTFVSTNGTDIMTIENSNNEWIDNTNRLGEEFYIKKIFTALNANDPAHVAKSQAISAAFAAFPQNAAARRTSIASSLYRLMAGETLTAEETAALTSTVVTAVNAAEPFALDGYYPLYYTAAAANAASSVSDHHTHDMDGETFYMPDGGTIYHGSYVLPEEEESSGY